MCITLQSENQMRRKPLGRLRHILEVNVSDNGHYSVTFISMSVH